MEAKAVGKYIRISPQKARLVADVVRGMEVDKALTTLRFMPKKGAGILRKVIESAVANATQNDQIDVDDLIVKKIMIYDQTDEYTIRAKTGWAMRVGDQIGWFIGYVEKGSDVYFFATNLQSKEPEEGFKSRQAITFEILKELRIL